MKKAIYILIPVFLLCSHPSEPLSSLPIVGSWDNSGNPNNECDSISYEFNANYSYFGTIVSAAYTPTLLPGSPHIVCVKRVPNPNPVQSNWKSNADTLYFQPTIFDTVSAFNWKVSGSEDTLYLRNIGLNEIGYHVYRRRN
ncbi:MAG TPA: hypothetical protein VLX68_03620 [Chitinivibrionales bacterium]|nr:hypothetical protein [Chitinivibrionales bacterium]